MLHRAGCVAGDEVLVTGACQRGDVAGLVRSGFAAQAGLAISFQAFFLLITFGFGLSSAMTALVGNAIGAGARAEAQLVAARGIGFGLSITVVLMILAWFLGPELIKVVSTDGDYRDAGTRYFHRRTTSSRCRTRQFPV